MKKVSIISAFMLLMFLIAILAYAQGPGMMGEGMGHDMIGSEQNKTMQETLNTTKGAEVFNTHCNVCHVNGGNVINPNMPLKGSKKLENFEAFLTFIRSPKMPDGSRGTMPSFSKSQISDEQAKELYQFITSEDGLDIMSRGPGGWHCPHYGQCRGLQRGYHLGPGIMGMMHGGRGMGHGMMMQPGMMGGGQQGWNYCPYCGQTLRQHGGYGMIGHDMMGRYGMGSGMMMRQGYYSQSEACQKFLDDTSKIRKKLYNKQYDYFEAVRSPKSSPETVAKMGKKIRELQEKIYSKAPQGCWL